MTLLQQKALIAFAVAHPNKCECKQCENFGGIKQLFRIYLPDDFTDINLRRIWAWLGAKLKKGSCHITDIDIPNDPTAPLLSDVVACSIASMVFTNNGNEYKLLKDILLDDSLVENKV